MTGEASSRHSRPLFFPYTRLFGQGDRDAVQAALPPSRASSLLQRIMSPHKVPNAIGLIRYCQYFQ